jgi:hypothetical protein
MLAFRKITVRRNGFLTTSMDLAKNFIISRERNLPLTAFKLLSHIWDRKKGSFFTGVYLPQKSDLAPPIERQYKPFQKHVSSY